MLTLNTLGGPGNGKLLSAVGRRFIIMLSFVIFAMRKLLTIRVELLIVVALIPALDALFNSQMGLIPTTATRTPGFIALLCCPQTANIASMFAVWHSRLSASSV
jgi:hypothetical protein